MCITLCSVCSLWAAERFINCWSFFCQKHPRSIWDFNFIHLFLAAFLFFWRFGLKQLFPIVFWLLQNSHWGFGSEDLVHGFGRSILFKEHHLSLLQRVTNLLWASATSTYSNQINNDPVLCASRRRRITTQGEEDGCREEGPIILFQEGGGMELRSAARNPIVLEFVLHVLLAVKLRLCPRYEERNIPNLPISLQHSM